jgi:hypothetical protein
MLKYNIMKIQKNLGVFIKIYDLYFKSVHAVETIEINFKLFF